MWAAHDGMGWWMLFGGMAWLLIIGLVVFAAVSFPSDRRGPPTHVESPLDIAKRRLAAGEISEEEFEGIQQKLRS